MQGRDRSALASALDLRQEALWYPNVPPKAFFLNEESFADQDLLSDGYRPLIWTNFGGSRGEGLEHIVAISVPRSADRVLGLQVVFDDTRDTTKSSKLGCYDVRLTRPHTVFTIDGAGGERLVSVQVGIHKPKAQVPADRHHLYEHNVLLKSVKVSPHFSSVTGYN